ncbi:MAG: 50S ribosomal protein L13 [Nitrospinota bacterium]|nr:50S ribosomal protein L13 [Nitrospinota bacterium]
MKTTYFARKEDFPENGKKWRIIDADGIVLGKLAVKVADALRGKDKPTFTHHVDTGDYVIVVNAAKVKLTGAKVDKKIYYHHTGFIGHLRSATASEMLEKHPERVIEAAVSGMLPKNKLRSKFMKKLKVYGGAAHTHEAQKPEKMEIN